MERFIYGINGGHKWLDVKKNKKWNGSQWGKVGYGM